jgi:hypothetical protein
MAVYTNDLRLTELATGEGSGTWGTTTNTNLELIAEAFSFGTEAITTNADTHTTTIADGSTDPGRSMFLKYTGTLDSTCTITIGPNTVSKLWFIENATSGSQSIIIKQGSGATITIANGQTKAIYSDGAGSGGAMVDAFTDLSVPSFFVSGDLDVDGTTNLDAVDVDGTVNFAADVTFADGADIITASAGTSNVRVGVNAGNSITSGGNQNVVIGDEAGTALTTGDFNVMVGYAAGDAFTTGGRNVGIGQNALSTDTLGSRSTAVGQGALGTQNFTTSTNVYNVAVGALAGNAITTGVQNTLIGGLAGDALTTGGNNVAIGFEALSTEDADGNNVAVGYQALKTLNAGGDGNNVAVGYITGQSVTTGHSNTLLGALAADALTEGDENVAVGKFFRSNRFSSPKNTKLYDIYQCLQCGCR